MVDAKPNLIRVTQSSTFTSSGQLSNLYNVSFSVGEHGPFTIQVPAADFNSARVLELMNKQAAEINAIQTGA